MPKPPSLFALHALSSATFAAMLSIATHAAAQTIPNPPTRLAPLAGSYYTPAPGQSGIGFYGTDLGWAFQHGNKLRFLFGDSWANTSGIAIGPLGDDTQGSIDLATFPTGPSVDSWVASHTYPDFPWHAAAPPLTMRTNAFAKVAPMPVYHGGFGGPLLDMGLGRTPVTGFSNGTTGAFAIFYRGVHASCSPSKACATGFVCDTQIRVCNNTSETTACYSYTGGGNTCPIGGSCNLPTGGNGICRDPGTFSGTTPEARFLGAVQEMRVGNSDLGANIDEQYYTRVWATNKFTNVVARTVQKYTPSGVRDYRPVTSAPAAEARVFLWGRPLFVGAKSQGRSLPLYFAYVDLPQHAANGNVAWAPRYYSGPGPTFSTDPSLAVPVSLSGGEPFDIVNQMSVSYIPNLDKWVMLYGGDIHPNVLQMFEAANWPHAVADPERAIHVRFASNPWGPWSAPTQAYKPGQPTGVGSGEFATKGLLHYTGCAGAGCVKGETNPAYTLFPQTNHGFLYAPSIVDAWTTVRGADADLYWAVSTWDPYQVVLLRSRVVH